MTSQAEKNQGKSIKEPATIHFIPTELEDHSYLDMSHTA